MNINKITKTIRTSPYLIQIAKDEVWEKTWNIDLLNTIPNKEEIKKYLDESEYKSVAVEALFASDNGVCILGLIFNNHLLIKTAVDFIDVFVKESSNFQDFEKYLDKLNKAFVGSNYLLNGEPDLIRIGIVNHWFSVGPCLIWQKGQVTKMSNEKLEELLETKPEIINTKLNYQGTSFVFNTNEVSPGLCHWIKSPCSRYKDGTWILDKQMILKYLEQWQGVDVK